MCVFFFLFLFFYTMGINFAAKSVFFVAHDCYQNKISLLCLYRVGLFETALDQSIKIMNEYENEDVHRFGNASSFSDVTS